MSNLTIPTKELAEIAKEFQKSALADNTRIAYGNDYKLFADFLDLAGYQLCNDLDRNTEILLSFLSYEAMGGKNRKVPKKISTIERYAASIATACHARGYAFNQKQIKLLLMGMARKDIRHRKQKNPLLPKDIKLLLNQIDKR